MLGADPPPTQACWCRTRPATSSPGWTPRWADWVVTPRRGKAVEINGLWYNALNLLARWLGEESGAEAARPHQMLG